MGINLVVSVPPFSKISMILSINIPFIISISMLMLILITAKININKRVNITDTYLIGKYSSVIIEMKKLMMTSTTHQQQGE